MFADLYRNRLPLTMFRTLGGPTNPMKTIQPVALSEDYDAVREQVLDLLEEDRTSFFCFEANVTSLEKTGPHRSLICIIDSMEAGKPELEQRLQDILFKSQLSLEVLYGEVGLRTGQNSRNADCYELVS